MNLYRKGVSLDTIQSRDTSTRYKHLCSNTVCTHRTQDTRKAENVAACRQFVQGGRLATGEVYLRYRYDHLCTEYPQRLRIVALGGGQTGAFLPDPPSPVCLRNRILRQEYRGANIWPVLCLCRYYCCCTGGDREERLSAMGGLSAAPIRSKALVAALLLPPAAFWLTLQGKPKEAQSVTNDHPRKFP